MPSIRGLLERGNDALVGRDLKLGESDSLMDVLLAFLGIAFFALLLAASLIVLKRHKRQRMMREQGLPKYDDIAHGDGRTRRLTIQTRDGHSSIVLVNGRPMLADPSAPPYSPTNVPQIHITFPDEQDEYGRQKNGRVMIVRVGDATVGLEPMREEQLPAYEKDGSHGFYSIDMNQIGGLKEKDRTQFQ